MESPQAASAAEADAERTGGLVDARNAAGLARIAAEAWWRSNALALGTAYRATRRLARAARLGESPVALLDDARHEAADAARALLTLVAPDVTAAEEPPPPTDAEQDEPLRRRWEELLERSTEIEHDEDERLHPAFAGILDHLHPDEARILRLLATQGPQAAVDVRNWRPFGIGSHVVAPGLTMIGQLAGCLHPERVQAYLANLFRLGLIWFSHDPVSELAPYQVLEAQPEVTDALGRAGRGTTVRRSIRLTPFGKQFCLACLPRDTLEFEAVTAGLDSGEEIPEPPARA